jgi:hypothetical protein
METTVNNWIPVKDYIEYYEINRDAAVRCIRKGDYGYIMEQRIDRAGYFTVRLTSPEKKKGTTVYIHRLLALAFIENPENKAQVTHVDGNKLNNAIENLKWVTRSESMKAAYAEDNNTKARSREVINILTGELYSSIKQAAKNTHHSYSTLKNLLKSKKSIELRYVDEYVPSTAVFDNKEAVGSPKVCERISDGTAIAIKNQRDYPLQPPTI